MDGADESKGEREAYSDTLEQQSVSDIYPTAYKNQNYAVVGLVAVQPSQELQAKIDAGEEEAFDTKFMLKIYAACEERDQAEKWALSVHPKQALLNHFVVAMNAPLPVPFGSDARMDDMNPKAAETPLNRYLSAAEQAEKQQVSEMERKCETAAKKGRVARRQQQKAQKKYIDKKYGNQKTMDRIPVQLEQSQNPPDEDNLAPLTLNPSSSSANSASAPVASKREGGRPATHVFLNRVDNAWLLVGLEPSELAEVKIILGTSLGQRLLRWRDGNLAITAEGGKMLAYWVESIRGLEPDSVKVYINAPGEKLMGGK